MSTAGTPQPEVGGGAGLLIAWRSRLFSRDRPWRPADHPAPQPWLSSPPDAGAGQVEPQPGARPEGGDV